MCTRYSLHQLEAFQRLLAAFGVKAPQNLRPRYNVPVGATMPALTQQASAREIRLLRFGLALPARAPHEKPLALANAQSESVLTKPAFKDAARHRRCLLPADGFFEWEHVGATRLPRYYQRANGEPFFLAGLWRDATEDMPAAFVVVTTRPNVLVGLIHSRMPVMLDATAGTEWLGDTPLPAERLQALCAPFPADAMSSRQVDPQMNSPRFDTSECIAPWTPPPEPTLFELP
jgi:putative SOS response-associated peptidase YedK